MSTTTATDRLRLQSPLRAGASLRVLTASQLLTHPFPERKWLLSGLMKERQMMMLYAPTGVGKSWFAWSMACAIAGAGKFHTYGNTDPKRVLYLDGEMDGEDAQERLRTCAQATGAGEQLLADNLLYLPRQLQSFTSDFPDLNNPEWQTHVIQFAKDQQVEVIVMDNFSTLAEIEDENSAAAFNGITAFLLRMKQAGIAGVLVHHSNKADSGYRGSQKLSVTFDLVVALRRPEAAEGNGCAFDVIIEKARSRVDTTPVQLILGDFGWTEGESEVAIAKALKLLKTGKYPTQTALADAMGVKKGTMSKMLTRARQAGMVTEGEIKGYLMRARETTVPDYDSPETSEVVTEEDF